MAALLWTLVLYLLNLPASLRPATASFCIESVQVVAPGETAECPWGTTSRVSPAGDGNVAFQCVCQAPLRLP
jgi:hypothetical protein